MGSQYFDIKPIAGRIGAKIIGVDLNTNLSDGIISDIRSHCVTSQTSSGQYIATPTTMQQP